MPASSEYLLSRIPLQLADPLFQATLSRPCRRRSSVPTAPGSFLPRLRSRPQPRAPPPTQLPNQRLHQEIQTLEGVLNAASVMSSTRQWRRTESSKLPVDRRRSPTRQTSNLIDKEMDGDKPGHRGGQQEKLPLLFPEHLVARNPSALPGSPSTVVYRLHVVSRELRTADYILEGSNGVGIERKKNLDELRGNLMDGQGRRRSWTAWTGSALSSATLAPPRGGSALSVQMVSPRPNPRWCSDLLLEALMRYNVSLMTLPTHTPSQRRAAAEWAASLLILGAAAWPSTASSPSSSPLVGPPSTDRTSSPLGSPCFVAVNNLVTATTAPNPTPPHGRRRRLLRPLPGRRPKCFTHLQIFPIFSDDAVSPGTLLVHHPEGPGLRLPTLHLVPDPKGLPHTVDSTKWPGLLRHRTQQPGRGPDLSPTHRAVSPPRHPPTSPSNRPPSAPLRSNSPPASSLPGPRPPLRRDPIGLHRRTPARLPRRLQASLVTKTRAGVATGGANPPPPSWAASSPDPFPRSPPSAILPTTFPIHHEPHRGRRFP